MRRRSVTRFNTDVLRRTLHEIRGDINCSAFKASLAWRRQLQRHHGRGSRTYIPNGFVGLKSTDLHIPGGTFCTLLGPSGSGKTTLLRAIAGLSAPTSGRIRIGDRDVTSLPVQARNVGFVFQNYALFPT